MEILKKKDWRILFSIIQQKYSGQITVWKLLKEYYSRRKRSFFGVLDISEIFSFLNGFQKPVFYQFCDSWVILFPIIFKTISDSFFEPMLPSKKLVFQVIEICFSFLKFWLYCVICLTQLNTEAYKWIVMNLYRFRKG